MNEKKDREQEFAIRAVQIIQTVVEELDEKGKRIWRKMLGLEDKREHHEDERS
ncbi:MAG: hypothetical protein ACFFEA_02990 [Candidatus Thorarchaeota archaeon]